MEQIEQARTTLYNTFTRVQHREYGPLVDTMREALNADPFFMSRACVHLSTGGSNIRDTADCAVIALLLADNAYPEFREAGRVILLGSDVYPTALYEGKELPGLPAFRILRAAEYIRHLPRGKSARLLRSTMTDWLRWLEADPDRFDSVTINNRRDLHWAYSTFHVAPAPRAQSVLFDNVMPPDSKLSVLRQIAQSDNPHTWMHLVESYRLPYRILASVLPDIPAAKVVLVQAMTPTEALNSRAWMERSGMLNIPEVRDAYLAKVARATKSAASIDHRKSAQGADAAVQAVVNEAKETAAKQQQRIQKPTLLLIDRSGSMESAIKVGIDLATRVAPLCDGGLEVWAFNDLAAPIKAHGDPSRIETWESAFRGLRCGGFTCPQAAFDMSVRGGFMPEQVVVVTDGGENRGSLGGSVAHYEERSGYHTSTVMLKVEGERDVMSNSFHQLGLGYDRFEFDGKDYYILDQVAAILGGEKGLTLVERILQIELPHR